MHYVIVFDASAEPYRNLSFVLPGMGCLVIGAMLLFRPEWLGRVFQRPLKQKRFFRWFYFLFALVWTVGAAAAIVSDADNADRSIRHRDCQIVEGRVEHYHPMPWTGHDTERFDVGGVPFSYSDYVVSAGFNKTASHGGPIREGLPVRICYLNGEILRLEVAQ